MTTPAIHAASTVTPGPGTSRPAPGPSTPAAINNNLASISTPKSHHTPGGHGSPAHRGTPRNRAGMAAFGGKKVAGGGGLGGKTTTAGNGDGTPAHSSSGAAAHGTPFMFGTSSFNFGSPAVTFTSPNASGVGSTNIDALTGFTNPPGSYTGMDGGTGMGISLSSLGINMMGPTMSSTGSTVGKTDDAERKRRVEAILETIGQRPGRISREGLERLGRKCGLDTQMGEVDDLAMAGKNILVDFEFASNQSQSVKRVAVTLATASDALTEHAEKAAKILQQNLTPPTGDSTVNATLEKFADNLERLARMDRLSVPGASCFDAIFGVYASLKRLYEHEKEAAQELFGTSKRRKAEREVMCKKSGMPRMHAGRRVGLALGYWMDRHLIEPRDDVAQAVIDMAKPAGNSNSTGHSDEDEFAKLVIECEPLPSAMYPPIAITTDWISERVEKPSEEADITMNGSETIAAEPRPVIEWLDPPPPVLPTLDTNPLSADGIVNASITGQPQVRFVARFEPPVILPLHIAAQVYSSVGVDISQDIVSHTTIASLALPQSSLSATGTEQTPKNLDMHRLIRDRGNETREYDLTLFPTRIELARMIDNMPFIHPKQLIAILPVLRQYSFVTKLIQNTFSPAQTQYTSNKKLAASSHLNGTGTRFMDASNTTKRNEDRPANLDAELTALLGTAPPVAEVARSVDVALSTTPIPQFTLVLAGPHGPKRVTLNILLNAEVEVVEQNIVDVKPMADGHTEGQEGGGGAGEEGRKVCAAVAKALMVCEDIVMWAEWVRQTYLENR